MGHGLFAAAGLTPLTYAAGTSSVAILGLIVLGLFMAAHASAAVAALALLLLHRYARARFLCRALLCPIPSPASAEHGRHGHLHSENSQVLRCSDC
jgi:hypothetical protein